MININFTIRFLYASTSVLVNKDQQLSYIDVCKARFGVDVTLAFGEP